MPLKILVNKAEILFLAVYQDIF